MCACVIYREADETVLVSTIGGKLGIVEVMSVYMTYNLSSLKGVI